MPETITASVVNARVVAAADRIDTEHMQVWLKGSSEKLLVSGNFTQLFLE